MTARKIASVVSCLAGVVVLTKAGLLAFNTATVLGALACLLATSCYGLAGF